MGGYQGTDVCIGREYVRDVKLEIPAGYYEIISEVEIKKKKFFVLERIEVELEIETLYLWGPRNRSMDF